MHTLTLADWLAQDADLRRGQVLEGLDSQAEMAASATAVLARLEAADPALTDLADRLVGRGLTAAAATRALAEQLQGPRAREIRKWMTAVAAERELLAEARMLLEGGSDLWAGFIVRYLDASVDGVLAAVIRRAGPDAIEPLLALLADEDERDPDSESSGFAPIHAARFLGELGDARIIEPLLALLPDLVPGEPLIDTVEAALHGFGDALMAPTLAHIEAAEDDETRLALWMLLARSEIDDDRIRDALVGLLAHFPDEAAHGLSLYGDASVLPAVMAAFEALSDENPFKIVDMAGSLRDLGAELSPEQTERVTRAEAVGLARLEAEYGSSQPDEKGSPGVRRTLSAGQKKAAQQKKKAQRQMKKKARPKKKK